MVYGLFRDPDKKYGKLEEIVIDIEKYSHKLEWSHCSIQSIIWNLENPKIDKETLNFFLKELRDNINKREEAYSKYYYLKYECLRNELSKLFIITTVDFFLEEIDKLKKQKGLNNLYLEARDNNWLKRKYD